MAKLIINLNGIDGLTNRYFGDNAFSTGNPEARYLGTENQYAAGIVNPISNYGYLSPANGTSKAVTKTGGTNPSGIIGSTIVDTDNTDIYFYERGKNIHQLTSYTSITLDTASDFPHELSTSIGTDLEIYDIDGVRTLFYSYQKGVQSDIGVRTLDSDAGFLAYDGQSGNFTIGSTLTGADSSATATIEADDDNGAEGTLYLSNISGGPFQNDEVITDAATGAAVANGVNVRFYDDFLSDFVTNGFNLGATNHVMRVADNGFMYILDGSSVHKYDGTTDGGDTGTVTSNVLLFPAYFQLIDGLDYRGALWIALMRSTRNLIDIVTNTASFSEFTGVYVWDRKSTSVDMTDFIPISGVREIRDIFEFKGVPACFTVSSDRYTQLRIYNGREFEVVKEMGPEAYPKMIDSLHVKRTSLTWEGNDGIMYEYGKITPNDKDALYKLGDMAVFTGADAFGHGGAIIGVNSSESTVAGLNSSPEAYYVAFKSDGASPYLIKKWYPHAVRPNNTLQVSLPGNFFSLVKPLPKLSTIESITIYFLPPIVAGTNDLIDFSIYLNQSTTAITTVTLTGTDAARGYIRIPIAKRNVNFLQIGIVYKVGSLDIREIPSISYAELKYEPTEKEF